MRDRTHAQPLAARRGSGTTIFAEMSALALATGSVNLGQGFPDTDGPAEVAEAAVAAIRAGRATSTRPAPGIPDLRLAIAEHQQRFYGLDARPGRPRSWSPPARPRRSPPRCSGWSTRATRSIALEPFYDSYAACIAMAGGVRVPVTLRRAGLPARPRPAARRGHRRAPG